MTRMANLNHALQYCCGDFRACPLFALQAEQARLRKVGKATATARSLAS